MPILNSQATALDMTLIPASRSSVAMPVLLLKAAAVHLSAPGAPKVTGLCAELVLRAFSQLEEP